MSGACMWDRISLMDYSKYIYNSIKNSWNMNISQTGKSSFDLKNSSDLSTPCHSKKITLWLVLLDNIPSIFLFILGFLIINLFSATGAIIFAVYVLISVIWFWARICPYWHHFGTHCCPCGYGAISSKTVLCASRYCSRPFYYFINQ